jgi:2-polyprenyl-3-methyl-5-hydroxy-6-metoxy-1,4-benzoquinol methylase
MVKSSFDAYGELARSNVSATELSGRYQTQAEAERRIVADVGKKLAIDPRDSLLDVGCGAGNLLIPLSFTTADAVGIDHPDVISFARRYSCDARVRWLAGQFPGVAINERFDCVLLYSVIQCIASFSELLPFIDAAADLLKPGGRLLIGDIPNSDKKRRFLESEAGQIFEMDWQKSRRENPGKESHVFDGATGIGTLSDAEILGLAARVRANGFDSYILPQPKDLPFGRTREDILIVRP